MLLFRSLAIGMLCAILFLVAEPRTVALMPVERNAEPAPTIIDVASGVPVTMIGSLLHLDPGEYVVAIDDRQVHDDLEAGAILAASSGKRFFDLSVAGATQRRRILVLMH